MASPSDVDNELDIHALFYALWQGKYWIASSALLCVFIAFSVSLWMKQEWNATAIIERPTVMALGSYYTQQQFLYPADNAPDTNLVIADAYQEFLMQLEAYDTRRDFWLQTDYYKKHKEKQAGRDALLLDELIKNIHYTPGDNNKNTRDGISLEAETAADAKNLLCQYIAFSSQRAADHLGGALIKRWEMRVSQLQAQITRQQQVANTVYDRQISRLRQSLHVAQQAGIAQVKIPLSAEPVPDSELFLLGYPLLRARLNSLEASGPDYDQSYDQNKAMLAALAVKPVLTAFQTYRYLQTPVEPVQRDSPRRVFLMVMWGTVGLLAGTTIALIRRRS